ncbi:MAG TPA: HEAT repeat domain-containing protein [Myxococcales bacterium]|jgi:HEAT repeat protein|nr:HEAT repeat domain-containing protein [Myxococcales bacterium]
MSENAEAVKPEVLVSRLASEHEPWRLEAEARLIALGGAAVELLVGAVRHANPAVRLHAVHALARIGDPRGIPAVVGTLGDAENLGAVAIAAEKALVEWGAAVKPELLAAARSGPVAIRARAVRALGKIGGADLEPELEAMLKDPQPAIRTQAGAALGEVAGERAVEKLAPLLQDPDKWVRYGVAEALVRLGSTRGEKVLEDARDDPEEQGSHTQFWAEELLDQVAELRRTGQTTG